MGSLPYMGVAENPDPLVNVGKSREQDELVK
jgi:hypothetical protein